MSCVFLSSRRKTVLLILLEGHFIQRWNYLLRIKVRVLTSMREGDRRAFAEPHPRHAVPAPAAGVQTQRAHDDAADWDLRDADFAVCGTLVAGDEED